MREAAGRVIERRGKRRAREATVVPRVRVEHVPRTMGDHALCLRCGVCVTVREVLTTHGQLACGFDRAPGQTVEGAHLSHAAKRERNRKRRTNVERRQKQEASDGDDA